MTRSIIWTSVLVLAFSLGCSREDAEKATDSMQDAANSATQAAGEMADHAGHAAGEMADQAAAAADDAGAAAREAAASLSADPAEACLALAEQRAWDRALEVCKQAHEAMPDNLGLEHAYQQAQAAAAN